MTGKIKTLNVDKGYGFIRAENGGEFFFHMSGLQNCFMNQLAPGMTVSFETNLTPKGMRAEQVTLLGE